jgi:protein-S-isoprenylcysteine O-methyltransferase Ste14
VSKPSTRAPTPTYLRVAGGLTVLLGLAIFIWMPYLGHPWVARAAGAVVVAGGVGLVFGQRWAWPFVLLSAIPMFFAAFVFFLPPGDTDPYELDHPFGVLFFIVGCLLVAASMTQATRDWLTRRSP